MSKINFELEKTMNRQLTFKQRCGRNRETSSGVKDRTKRNICYNGVNVTNSLSEFY